MQKDIFPVLTYEENVQSNQHTKTVKIWGVSLSTNVNED